jgi:hypothetical protein
MYIDNSDILFQPWVGDRYGSNSLFKIPILIVGESNYTDDLERERPHDTFTHRLIKSTIEKPKHRFFSNIQRSFVENATEKESRENFWHSVAHHEYIQDWLPRPGVPPTEDMWKKAKPIFKDVVTELKPKCILLVCKRVYDRVSLDFVNSTPLSIDESDSPTLSVYKKSHPTLLIEAALASWIYHPTAHHGGFRRARGIVSLLVKASGGETAFS